MNEIPSNSAAAKPDVGRTALNHDTEGSRRSPSKQDRIHVVSRFRPQLQFELDQDGENCAYMSKDQKSVRHDNDPASQGGYEVYQMDRALGPKASQEHVYRDTGKQVLDPLFQGINCAIYVYGQTAAGKTHTMLGPQIHQSEGQGILTRTVHDIFARIEGTKDADDGTQHSLTFSCVELYEEEFYDLLRSPKTTPKPQRQNESKSPKLKLLSDIDGAPYLQGATEVVVDDIDSVEKVLVHSQASRIVSTTRFNECSSRSHFIAMLTLTQRPTNSDQTVISTVSFVDLAGAESTLKLYSHTDLSSLNSSFRNKDEAVDTLDVDAKLEVSAINRSITTLGKIILALSRRRRNRHIPYRDSKLTRLLQHTLGNNCFTILVLCLSPSTRNRRETRKALQFGEEAMRVRNFPVPVSRASRDVLKLRRIQQTVRSSIIASELLKKWGRGENYFREFVGTRSGEHAASLNEDVGSGKVDVSSSGKDDGNDSINKVDGTPIELEAPQSIDEFLPTKQETSETVTRNQDSAPAIQGRQGVQVHTGSSDTLEEQFESMTTPTNAEMDTNGTQSHRMNIFGHGFNESTSTSGKAISLLDKGATLNPQFDNGDELSKALEQTSLPSAESTRENAVSVRPAGTEPMDRGSMHEKVAPKLSICPRSVTESIDGIQKRNADENFPASWEQQQQWISDRPGIEFSDLEDSVEHFQKPKFKYLTFRISHVPFGLSLSPSYYDEYRRPVGATVVGVAGDGAVNGLIVPNDQIAVVQGITVVDTKYDELRELLREYEEVVSEEQPLLITILRDVSGERDALQPPNAQRLPQKTWPLTNSSTPQQIRNWKSRGSNSLTISTRPAENTPKVARVQAQSCGKFAMFSDSSHVYEGYRGSEKPRRTRSDVWLYMREKFGGCKPSEVLDYLNQKLQLRNEASENSIRPIQDVYQLQEEVKQKLKGDKYYHSRKSADASLSKQSSPGKHPRHQHQIPKEALQAHEWKLRSSASSSATLSSSLAPGHNHPLPGRLQLEEQGDGNSLRGSEDVM
eukprot:gb/GECG01016783.1/.p1 GENE.gb/GECG01016783.1/~~gb/GECG01016783.1/.p1  ORF type:complete len:1027 (+),score=129.28 gb/GECG01016783.1/:1-3081(+)